MTKDGQTLPLFPEDSLVNHSPLPGSVQARKMTAISGRRCLESFVSYSRPGLSVKTFMDYFLSMTVWRSTALWLHWKLKHTRHGYSIIRLRAWEPPIDDTGSSLWPTASARDWKDTPGMKQEAFDKSGSFRNRIDQLPRMVYAVQKGVYPEPRVAKLGGGKNRANTEGDTRRKQHRDCCDARRRRSFESFLGRVADGFSQWLDEPEGIARVTEQTELRSKQLTALGNSVVPAQAYPVFASIAHAEGVINAD